LTFDYNKDEMMHASVADVKWNAPYDNSYCNNKGIFFLNIYYNSSMCDIINVKNHIFTSLIKNFQTIDHRWYLCHHAHSNRLNMELSRLNEMLVDHLWTVTVLD